MFYSDSPNSLGGVVWNRICLNLSYIHRLTIALLLALFFLQNAAANSIPAWTTTKTGSTVYSDAGSACDGAWAINEQTNPYLCPSGGNHCWTSGGPNPINTACTSICTGSCGSLSFCTSAAANCGYGAQLSATCPSGYTFDANSGQCLDNHDLSNNGPPPCNGGTNPINIGQGNKYQADVDYFGAGAFPLRFVRNYNSQDSFSVANGFQWLHSHSRVLKISADLSQVNAFRPDGKAYLFSQSGTSWIAPANVNDSLAAIYDGSNNITGWKYTTSKNVVETYSLYGKLVSITDRAQFTQSLTFSDGTTTAPNGGYLLDANGNPTTTKMPPGLAIRLTDAAGRSLSFGYDVKWRIVKMTDPAGQVFLYHYDANNNLSSVTYPDGNTKQYLYGETAYTSGASLPHALTGIIDENGARFATYWYDAQGRAIQEEHAPGLAQNIDHFLLTYSTDSYGNPVTDVTDPLNTLRTYYFQTIQDAVKPTGQSQPSGSGCGAASLVTTYDANGNIATHTDFNGATTNYVYDLTRNLETSRTEAVGLPEERTIATEWHPSFRLPTKITEPGRITEYTYDANSGNMLTKKITDAASGKLRQWTYTYTTAADNTLPNLLRSVDGPRTDVNDVTIYSYYPNGDLQTVTNALGHVAQITAYDPHGRATTMVDPNGLTTTLSYTPRGWLATRAVGAETTVYEYDGVGQITRVTFPSGSYVTYDYDDAHRLTDMRDSLGNRIHYTLDAAGNRTKEEVFDATDTLVTTKSSQFDALGRLWKDIGALNQTTTYEYDANGNLTRIDGPLTSQDDILIHTYDALNRLATTTDALNGVTSYGYDGLDQLISVTDPLNLVTQYTVTGLGEQTQLSSPDTGTTLYTYDYAGNLASKLDANGILTTYTYDALNRLTQIHFPDPNQDITYTYDGATSNGLGRLTGMSDPSGTTTYSYTNNGQLYQEVKTFTGLSGSFTTTYSYNANGNLTGITYPSGRQVTYTLDSADRLTQVSGSHDGPATTYATIGGYLPYGPYQTVTLGNGLATTITYDNQYQFDGQTVGSGPQLLSHEYSHDANGNVTAIADLLDSARDKTYGYDALDRLTSTTGPWPSAGSLSYTYDPVGNRLTEGGSLGSSTYTYSDNLLTGVTGAKNLIFSYDATGNTVSENNLIFVYDQNNRLIEVTEGSATLGTYVYDGQGRRVKKVANGQTTYFLYDQESRLIAEANGSGDIVNEYLYLPDRPLVKIDIDGASEEVYYYHTDHLGTPLFLTNSTGQKVWSAELLPFGEGYDINEDVDGDQVHVVNNLRFPGQYYDAERGLHYNLIRDYHPMIGRYTQSDPIGLAAGINTFAYVDSVGKPSVEPNLYQYTGNNPVNRTDPLGLFWGIPMGESYGEAAAEYWAGRYNRTGNILYAVPGVLASTWTEDTSWITALTLTGGYASAGWAAKTGPWLGKIVYHAAHSGGPHQYPHLQVMIRTGLHATKHIRIRLGNFFAIGASLSSKPSNQDQCIK